MRCTDDALVLRRTPFRETSLLVHFFTRQDGLLAAVARGVRATGRAATTLDRAVLAGFHTLATGRYARSAHALSTLTAVEIRHPRHRLLHRPAALLAAQVVQEILYRFMAPFEPNPSVFELLEWTWNGLEAGDDPLALIGLCQGRLIRALGYGWRTDCCVGCGTTEQIAYFSVKRGQVVCERCAAPYVGVSRPVRHGPGNRPANPPLFPLGSHLHEVLHHLEWSGTWANLPQPDQAMVYRIGMACLLRLGGTPLLADAPFRQMIGLPPVEPC
ncbi:MAG: DNA repair protein RecO [Magnetococcus sp. DMHC-8]